MGTLERTPESGENRLRAAAQGPTEFVQPHSPQTLVGSREPTVHYPSAATYCGCEAGRSGRGDEGGRRRKWLWANTNGKEKKMEQVLSLWMTRESIPFHPGAEHASSLQEAHLL